MKAIEEAKGVALRRSAELSERWKLEMERIGRGVDRWVRREDVCACAGAWG